MMLDGGEYSPCSESSEPFSCINTLPTVRKKRNKNKRRFNNDQIKLLETMFESESRPEPRKKVQLARDLGLQPRQVAIWFQNKRARWKSKQIEQDYSILRNSYNNLASRFEILKKEKQALVVQLQKLNDMAHKSQDESQSCKQVQDNNICGELSNGGTARTGSEGKPSSSVEISEHGLGVLSDDDISMKAEYFGLDGEPGLLNMVEPADSPLTSPEDWSSLDTDGLFQQSSNSYQWWDFWS